MSQSKDYILVTYDEGVTTITMNNPKKLNGWDMKMMDALKAAMADAASNEETKVVILTGTGKYYSAGVNLAGTIKVMHPRKLRDMIIEHNQSLFDLFLDFPKPLIAAVNGPAIGATVTSATLFDAIVASEEATFSTPFARLGIPPEGCSSVHFARIMGENNAQRMLGPEGWRPTGAEALDIGLVQHLAPANEMMNTAVVLAKAWIAEGRTRTIPAGGQKDELKAVNAKESVDLANAFLSAPFLMGQYRFLKSKKKTVPALTFLSLRLTRPLWGKLL